MSSISVAVEEAIGFDIRPAPLQPDEDQENTTLLTLTLGQMKLSGPTLLPSQGGRDLQRRA
jgi:hypothetical protein